MNISLLKTLGASVDPEKLNSQISFDEFEKPVNLLLDNCHCIKNVRNAFSDLGVLYDGDGGKIEWRFIVELFTIQNKSTFHFANKITADTIFWQNNKMKVKLAVHVFSRSTASALDFCREDLNLPQFKESEATSKFLRMFDELFDLLNSKSKFGIWAKAPISKNNLGYWQDTFITAKTYILGLKDSTGKCLINGRRKSGFLGFLLNMQAVKSIFKHFVDNGPLNYLLTFKLSQDHLETFFGCIRARLGSNNNPTVLQEC